MSHDVIRSIALSFYILALFAGIGFLAYLATRKLDPMPKRYGVLFAFLFLFLSFCSYVVWHSWQIHLLLPLVYLLLMRASQGEKILNFHQPVKLRIDNVLLALGVFFIYAFVSTAWAYFPAQSFSMTFIQSISIGFTCLIFRRIQQTRAEMFAPGGELARLCLVVGIGSFVLMLLANAFVSKVFLLIYSGFEIYELNINQKIVTYLEYVAEHLTKQVFFDSGFTFFAVLAFPLAMLIRDRIASLLLLGGILLTTLLISKSQAAIIGLLCGVCIVLFLPRLPGWMQRSVPWIMLGGITAIPFFALLLPKTLEFYLFSHFQSSFFVNTFLPRLWIYKNTILLDIWMHPWFGYGLNAINLEARDNFSIFDMFFAVSAYGHPHNHTLTLLVELGIAGLLLFLWVCVSILQAIKTLKEQCQPYALGAFFSALCLPTFTHSLWGLAIIIWCVAFIVFALFGRSVPVMTHQKDSAT